MELQRGGDGCIYWGPFLIIAAPYSLPLTIKCALTYCIKSRINTIISHVLLCAGDLPFVETDTDYNKAIIHSISIASNLYGSIAIYTADLQFIAQNTRYANKKIPIIYTYTEYDAVQIILDLHREPYSQILQEFVANILFKPCKLLTIDNLGSAG